MNSLPSGFGFTGSNRHDSSTVTKAYSEYLQQLANEPSMGLYHVEEHIRKAVPGMRATVRDLKRTKTDLDEKVYDAKLSNEYVVELSQLKRRWRTLRKMVERTAGQLENAVSSGRAPKEGEFTNAMIEVAISEERRHQRQDGFGISTSNTSSIVNTTATSLPDVPSASSIYTSNYPSTSSSLDELNASIPESASPKLALRNTSGSVSSPSSKRQR